MPDLVTAAAVAFGVVFLAELGDKTQLLAVGFGARYSLRQVLFGFLLGYGAASILAVVVGGVLGTAFPERPVEVIGGAIFLLFSLTTLLDDDDNDDSDDNDNDGGATNSPSLARPLTRTGWLRTSVVAAIGFSILVAEMGDKTQVASATLATRSQPVGVWIGGTLGATASGMVGAFAGTFLGERLPAATLRLGSAALFAIFGVLMVVGVF